MAVRDLCTLEDVLRYVPGYTSVEATDDTIAALITAESEAIQQETGRLIIAWESQPETRAYELDCDRARLRRVDVDDLAFAGDTDITVELLNADSTAVETIDREKYRPLYERRRQSRAPWEPITALEFPAALAGPAFSEGQTVLVTGNFGFPQVPPFIVEACAKRVILRYASDVAPSGTQFANALAEINLAGLFASARDDVDRLKRKVMIA